jgi:hypothetical protein
MSDSQSYFPARAYVFLPCTRPQCLGGGSVMQREKYLMQRHLIAPEKKTGTVFPALFLSDALDAFPGAE